METTQQERIFRQVADRLSTLTDRERLARERTSEQDKPHYMRTTASYRAMVEANKIQHPELFGNRDLVNKDNIGALSEIRRIITVKRRVVLHQESKSSLSTLST